MPLTYTNDSYILWSGNNHNSIGISTNLDNNEKGHNTKLNYGNQYTFQSLLTHDNNVKLKFYVYNKITDTLVRTKEYNISFKADAFNYTTDTNITGGSTTDNNGNTLEFNSGNDNNISNYGLFSGITSNSNFSDIVGSVNDTFSTFSIFFSLLPPWIWALIGTALIVFIVMRVLGR